MFRRSLKLPRRPAENFFLWGPRQTGKTSLLKGLRELAREHRRVRGRVLVSMEERPRRTEDGIDILPAREFARRLWKGELTGA